MGRHDPCLATNLTKCSPSSSWVAGRRGARLNGGRLNYGLGAVPIRFLAQILPESRVHAAPAHIAITGHADPGVAELVGPDPRR
jgi:hypothetical protein